MLVPGSLPKNCKFFFSSFASLFSSSANDLPSIPTFSCLVILFHSSFFLLPEGHICAFTFVLVSFAATFQTLCSHFATSILVCFDARQHLDLYFFVVKTEMLVPES